MAGEDRILTPDEMWDDAPDKYDKPSYTGSRGTGLYKKSLKALEKERERNKIRKEYPSLTDELADELIEKRKRNKGMLEWSEDLQRAVMTDELKKAHPEYTDEQIAEKVDYELGGTEMEIEEDPYDSVTLPEMAEEETVADVPEMETEVVDLPPEDENEKEIVIDRKDDTIVDPDKTLAEEVTPDLPEGEDLTVIDNDPEDDPDIVTDEEVAAPDKLKKQPKQKQPKQKDEPKQEEEKQKKPVTDETKPKQEEDKTSSGYDRYPTGVRVGEDILGEVNTVAGGVKDVAEKIGKQGANSGSIANEVARAVPHYDYRSLFR